MKQNILLWDGPLHSKLLPFSYTRPISEIRIGILTIKEKYSQIFDTAISCITQDYLSKKYKSVIKEDNLIILAGVLPNAAFAHACNDLQFGEFLVKDTELLAVRLKEADLNLLNEENFQQKLQAVPYNYNVKILNRIWQIFSWNEEELKKDFQLLTMGRKSQPIPESNFVKGAENIFLEEGALVENCSLNASSGPIYIGKDAEIMEGCLVRGPFALGEHSQLKLGAKIYGATTIGPHCKVGGEVNNSVFFGYSNKAHDGFIGNAVIGEWCNIGADSNNSNLKNNYEEVKIWDHENSTFMKTGLQFCGLFFGDHTKCGINTMFNTGTVAGVSANIFGGGFPRTFIPSYSWGGASGFTTYKLEKAFETAEKVFERRKIEFSEEEKAILSHVFELTKNQRKQ